MIEDKRYTVEPSIKGEIGTNSNIARFSNGSSPQGTQHMKQSSMDVLLNQPIHTEKTNRKKKT